jgi:hypothetical protein
VMAVVDPTLTPTDRLRTISSGTSASSGAGDLVRDLAEDRSDVWRRPWIRACALFAAVESLSIEADHLDLSNAVNHGRDDAILHETLAGLAQRQQRLPSD